MQKEQKKWIVGKRKFALAMILSAGILALGGLTAAAALKETANIELKDVKYNGQIYTYALQKQYETSNPDAEVSFEEVEGMKLDTVDYQTLDTVYPTKTEILEEKKVYKELTEKDESGISKTLTKDGNTYSLDHIEWSEEPNIEHVSYTLDYGYATAKPDAAGTYEYTYTSPVTNKENTVTLPFVRMDKGEESWVDGFSATVTFENLDGVYFKLGNHEFAYNADKLQLTESDYKELVKMLGYDTSKYRLNNAAWSGKAYTKNGVKYRKATATGQQYAASYKAVYEDDVQNGSIYTANAVYTYESEVTDESAAPTYVMQAVGYYKKAGVWTNIITFLTENKAAPVVVFGMLILLVIIIVALFNMKGKRQYAKREEEMNE